jgi:hypothetical protein
MKSLTPWEFLDRIKSGATVIPTDKNYKAYLEDDQGHDKFYYETMTLEQRAEFVDLFNQGKIKIGAPGYFYVAPFFMTFRLKDLNKTSE